MLVVTQSRSGWIGAVVGMLAFAVFWGLSSRRRRWHLVTWGMLACIILVGIFVISRVDLMRMTALWGDAGVQTEVAGTISLMGRVEIWSRALYAIQDFPFTGCGLGTFREVVWLLYPLFRIPPDQDIAHAHNIFLQVALDTGIPGLIAYLALLGIAGKLCWDTARRSVQLRPLALGLMASLIAFHTYGLADALAPGSKPGLIFWYILGLCAAIERLSHKCISAEIG